MARTGFTRDRLEGDARTVRDIRSRHDDQINSFKNLVNALQEDWSGNAHDAYQQKFAGMQSMFTNFSENLGAYAEFLDNYARDMSDVDTAYANKLR